MLLLQAENDELKLQEIQDRQRIQQLLAMTQPLEQTVTYRQGGAPSSVTAYPKGSAGAGAGAASSSAAAAAGAGRTSSPTKASGRPGLHGQQQQHGSGGGERVLRTVFLPTVDSDFLLLKIESLQAQLNEQVGARAGSHRSSVCDTCTTAVPCQQLVCHGSALIPSCYKHESANGAHTQTHTGTQPYCAVCVSRAC